MQAHSAQNRVTGVGKQRLRQEMETRIEAQRQQTDQQRQEMETQLDAQRHQTEQQRQTTEVLRAEKMHEH